MPVAIAAKRFSVPRITLMYKAKGKTPQYRRMGPDTILTKKKEENILVKWVLGMGRAIVGYSKYSIYRVTQLNLE